MPPTHLQVREIQAPLAAKLIRSYARVMGRERALDVACETIRADAAAAGAAMADKLGANDLNELARLVRELWSADAALELEILEQTKACYSFNVTRCRYVEMYDRLGLRDLGYVLSCSRDAAFAGGFNPQIRLERSQTIMEGASFCDFRFVLDSGAERAGSSA